MRASPSVMDISTEDKIEKEYSKIIMKKDLSFIASMIDKCSQYTTGQLVTATHAQEPWKNAYKNQNKNVIDNNKIKEFFAKRRGKDGKQ